MMAVVDRVTDAPWLTEVVKDFFGLLDLQPNWNSYGAPPISPSSIGYGLTLLDRALDARTARPAVIPSPSGGFQFEWHQRGVDLEVEVLPSGQLSVYFANRETHQEHEVDGSLDNVAPYVREQIQSHLTNR
jgi:hypothetical protein